MTEQSSMFLIFDGKPIPADRILAGWDTLDSDIKARLFEATISENNREMFDQIFLKINQIVVKPGYINFKDRALSHAINCGRVEMAEALINHMDNTDWIDFLFDAHREGKLAFIKLIARQCREEDLKGFFSQCLFAKRNFPEDIFEYLYTYPINYDFDSMIEAADKAATYGTGFPIFLN